MVIDTEDVDIYTGYPGHEIVVTAYEADPANPFHSIEKVVLRERLTSADANHKEISVLSGTSPAPIFISVRVRVDTTVNPGLYDDFLFTRLSFRANDYALYAVLGFRNP